MKFMLQYDLLPAPHTDANDQLVGVRLSGAAADPFQELKDLVRDVEGKDVPSPFLDRSAFDQYVGVLTDNCGPLFPWLGGTVEPAFACAEDVEEPANTTSPPGNGAQSLNSVSIRFPEHEFGLTDDSLLTLRHSALIDLARKDGTGLSQRTNQFYTLTPFELIGMTANDQPKEIEEIGDGSSRFSYEAFLAGLASLPGPIPHGQLNLCHFATYPRPKAGVGKRVVVVSAPVLTLTNGVKREPDWARTKWKRYDADAAKQLMAIIPYVEVQGQPTIEVRCRAVDPNESMESSNSFLDRETLWVRRGHDSQRATPLSDGVAFDDWLGKLPERLADVFDLPQLLLRLVEQDANAKRSEFTDVFIAAESDRVKGARALADAMLLALRDVIGPGCVALDQSRPVKGPNGAPAQVTIIDFVNEVVAQPTRLDAAAVHDLAGRILEADYKFRTTENGYDQWFKMLARVLANGLDYPDDGESFAQRLAEQVAIDWQATGAFDPSPLRRVVDAALLPANAAAIQLELWDEAGPPGSVTPDVFRIWLNAARAAFDVLAARGFRLVELLRKANTDFPWVCSAGIWRPGKPEAKDTDLLQENVLRTLVGYVHGTLCASPDTKPDAIEGEYAAAYRRREKIPKGARKLVEDEITRLSGEPMMQWFPLPMDEGNDILKATDLSPDAHGVALQIDRLIVGNEGETPDFNEDLAGYGLLMRRVKPQTEPWRCLTATWAHIKPDESAFDLVFQNNSRMVLGALPVAYTARMPQSVVIYDNRPIAGDDLSQKPDVELADADPRILRLYQPKAADVPDDDPTVLPFLAYGAVFEAVPFGISNHGAMPVEIRADYPVILDSDKLKMFAPQYARRFAYLRCTGIGALQARPEPTQLAQQAETYHPLVFPKDVKTLAEEILVPEGVITFPQSKTAKTLKPVKARTALLLADEGGDAAGTAGELTLKIEAPVTTIEDFDRWIALDELMQTAELRKKLRAFRKELRTRIQDGMVKLLGLELKLSKAKKDQNETEVKKLQKQIDELKDKLALQDPSVTGLVVVVTLLRRDGSFFSKAIDETEVVFFPWQWTWAENVSADNPFKENRKPISLLCKVDKAAAKVFAKTNDSTGTVLVRGGDVALARCFAAVPESVLTGKVHPDGERRFDSILLEKGGLGGRAPTYTNPNDGVKYALFSLYELSVEVAWPLLPSATEIGDDKTEITTGKTVTGSVVPPIGSGEELPGAVRLAFTRKQSVAMDAIGSMAVGSQAWRWTGRAIAPFPFHRTQHLNELPPVAPDSENPPTPSDYAFLWDVEGFAERLDETLDDERTRVPITETVVGDVSNPQPVRIALRGPSRERLARYLRFRITAHNRYASAYRAARFTGRLDSRIEAKWVRKDVTVKSGWSTDWFRVLRPAALPRLHVPAELPPPIVPKPGIRAVLPLTRAIRIGDEETPDPVSGVLVIVDGAWFEHAGPAEWMLGRVEVAKRKTAAAAEFGPDPVLRTYGLGGSVQNPVPATLIETVPLELVGPLGHSFDTGTATGLFLNSSFVVRAPGLVRSGYPQDVAAWWMGKLAFRRLVLAEGTTDYWNGVQKAPYTLESDQIYPQVSAAFHEIKATGADAEFRMALSGELTFDGNTKPLTAITVSAKRVNSSWSFEIDGKLILGFSITEPSDDPKFDFRVVAARRVSEDSTKKRFAWYEILLLVRPWNKAWASIWEGRQFEQESGLGLKAKLGLELKTDGSKDVTFEYRDSRDFQVSEITEGRWAQFLPNSETLARASAVPLGSLTLSSAGDTKLLLSAETGGALVWLGTDALVGSRVSGKSDQGLFNLLLLTRRVASVAGTEEEAYLGLYYSAKGYGPNEKQKSNAAVELEWFGSKKEGEPKLTGRELTGRILTVRVGNLSRDVKDAKTWKDTLDQWKEKPWDQFFPDERGPEYRAPPEGSQVFGERKKGDAGLQIIEIYAPIYSKA